MTKIKQAYVIKQDPGLSNPQLLQTLLQFHPLITASNTICMLVMMVSVNFQPRVPLNSRYSAQIPPGHICDSKSIPPPVWHVSLNYTIICPATEVRSPVFFPYLPLLSSFSYQVYQILIYVYKFHSIFFHPIATVHQAGSITFSSISLLQLLPVVFLKVWTHYSHT